MTTRPSLLRALSYPALVAFGVSIVVFGLLPAAYAAKQLYTCGMHPQIIRDAPGDCPICGMALQPILGTAAAQQGANAPIQIDSATVQRMNLKTAVIERGPVRREVRTVGTVAFNENGYRDITLKYEAWIEKLQVGAIWTSVRKGDPLFEIYSPELYNAELNYLVARRSDGGSGPLSRAARSRLELLDLPAEEIADIERSGEVLRSRTYRSPVDGIVSEKMVVSGQMMKSGERLFRLADISTVWILAQIFEGDLPFVTEGQTARIATSYGAERLIEGKVERLLPLVDAQTRSISARLMVPNADAYLRPGMFVEVRFVAQLAASAVLVPETAVLRSGEKNTVFVALDGGFFEPRELKLGNRSQGGNYEVLSGLSAGERVVTSGQFMLDSESQLREAIEKMTKGDLPPETRSTGVPVAPSTVLYTCPMEEHVDVVADKAGKCPRCGMRLVPTSESDHGRQSEEIWHKQHPGPVPSAPAHQHGT
jgi:multidrug efflux pump subunit AcrA (membrane-fusion protein)